MSPRTAPVLAIALLATLLAGGCGGGGKRAEVPTEPVGEASASRPVDFPGRHVSPDRDRHRTVADVEEKASPRADRPAPPGTAPAHPAQRRHAVARVIETITGEAAPEGDRKTGGNDALAEIVAQARKEGVRVIRRGGGGGGGEGVAEILRQLGAKGP